MIPRALLLASPENTDTLTKAILPLTTWVTSCHKSEQLDAALSKSFFPFCILELETEIDAALIQKVKSVSPKTKVLVVSENPRAGLIVESIRKGASGFVESFDSETLLHEFSKLVTEANAKLEAHAVEQTYGMVGNDQSMKEIFSVIERVKNSDCNVLISGESGTGKELIAQAIHSSSSRGHKPFVAVNCAAIPATLIESELFGHAKGAFTGASQARIGRFQMSGSGTLFLDEISELSFDLQAKLLRAIQTRQFEPVGSMQSVTLNSRIIAASNQNLEDLVNERKFRDDLFYRLNVVPIFIPPLRQRKTDIPLLVKTFIEKFSLRNKKRFLGMTEESMSLLMNYSWPGNVRELENLIERVVVLKQNNTMIEAEDFPTECFRSVSLDRYVATVQLPVDGLNLSQAVNDFENELIIQALQKTKGNKNKAASLLNLNRTTLVEKMKRKKIHVA